jgi:cytochrome d ubiquinol oxidase subunit II
MDLNTVWFILVGVLIAGYAVLDGFDLGVGVLSLFARSEEERQIHMKAIGPVWDGNEVWLLTGGGALFAAFPMVYATVFSGFYLALMLLLVALIARAVSLEFRSLLDGPGWRRGFDLAFGVGSLVPALLFGVAVGNVLRGVPVTADGEWAGSFLGLLNPYAILVGLVSLSFFTLHGALYLRMKAEGELEARLARWIPGLWVAFVALYATATVATVFVSPFLFEGAGRNPLFLALTVVVVASIGAVPLLSRTGKAGSAFTASAAAITTMILVAAVSMFPRLVPSSLDLANSLTIYNAASSPRTLTVMLVIALLGMPLVLGYTVFVYRLFRGKVQAGGEVYGARVRPLRAP